MKNLFRLLAPLALVLSGCVYEELPNNELVQSEGRIFTASLEQDETRTYVEEGNLLRWNAGDQISLFDGNTLNRQYKFDGETGDNSGTFSIVNAPYGSGNDLNANYAVYPYASDAKITESGVISITLPADQNYAKNSFGLGANTMVAVTENHDDTFLKFKNVGGYLKLQLYGDDVTVKSIELTGNSNEKIAGKASIIPTYSDEPKISMSNDATSSITLNCGEGVKVGSTAENATAFWIVVPPTTFKGGFTITITDINDETFIKSTSNEIAIERNVIKPMKAFEVIIDNVTEDEGSAIPNNKIWYTATEKVVPNKTDGFGANIESNEWDEATGEGIITFDGEVTTIERAAFYGCSHLTSVTIPNSVTNIEPNAFGECSSLQEFSGKFASEDRRCLITDGVLISFASASLAEYAIPDSVTEIGELAFNCCGLISVTIPDSVTEIGEFAFAYCDNLTSVTIPDSVTSIGEEAFYICSNLTSATIGDGVTTIGIDAFYGCIKLASVYCKAITPPSLGSRAFQYYDSNASGLRNLICKIYVPAESADTYSTSWHDYAEAIVAYDFEKGEIALDRCKIFYSASAKVEPYRTDVFGANIESNEWDSTTGKGVITFDGEVTTIGVCAFYFRSDLTSITIPDSVTKIGDSAFTYCSGLTSVSIPNSVTTIERTAFCNSGLISVTIPYSVTKIEQNAFQNCHWLTSVYCKATTPPSLGGYAFDDTATDLMIYVPTESVSAYKSASDWSRYNTYIVENDFENNEIVPDTPEAPANNEIWYTAAMKIEPYRQNAFNATIKSNEWDSTTGKGVITFDGEVTKIGSSAFYNRGITSVTIPESVTEIGDSAFNYCSRLTSVFCRATTPPIFGSSMFGYYDEDEEGYCDELNGRIYVPSASVKAYRNAWGWAGYADNIVGYDF